MLRDGKFHDPGSSIVVFIDNTVNMHYSKTQNPSQLRAEDAGKLSVQ